VFEPADYEHNLPNPAPPDDGSLDPASSLPLRPLDLSGYKLSQDSAYFCF